MMLLVFLILTHGKWGQSCTPTSTVTMVTMVTMGDDLQPGSLADRLLTGLGQPQINT